MIMGTKYYNGDEHMLLVKNGHVLLLSEAEFRAIQIQEIWKFQDGLGRRDNETAAMWIRRYAKSFRDFWAPYIFRSNETKRRASMEIEKHRWIESEKAGKDLGVSAEFDWLQKYGYLYQNHQQN